MKNLLLCTLLSLTICSCYVPGQIVWQDQGAGPSSRPRTMSDKMPTKPGSCFARCLMPDMTETKVIDELPLYTGTETDKGVELDSLDVVKSPASTKWIKKKADKNCLSANPEDCLVWCLVEQPAVLESYIYVKDTSATKLFKMTQITSTDIVKPGGYTEWKEVICDNKMSDKLITDVQSFLASEYQLSNITTGEWDAPTRNALKQYQTDKELPIGQLDLETLDSMGVQY